MWFTDEVTVPAGDFDHDIAAAVGHALTTQSRFRGQTARFLQLIQFVIGGLVARLQPLANDDMTRRTGADSSARVIERHLCGVCNVENAAWQSIAAVRKLLGINLDDFPHRQKGDGIFLFRQGLQPI